MKITFLSLAIATMFLTANAEEAKTLKKTTIVEAGTEKTAAPLVSPKKPKPAECVAPAEPTTPAVPAKPAKAATSAETAKPVDAAKPAEIAKSAVPATQAEAAKPAPGTCPQKL